MNSLSVQDVLGAAYKLNDWLNFFWNFYVVFSGVVVGWVFSSKEDWRKSQQIVVTLFYIGFACVSLGALIRTYGALDVTVTQLQSMLDQTKDFDATLISQFQSKYWKHQLVLHIGGDLLVLYCIWKLSRRGNAQQAVQPDGPASGGAAG